MKFRETHPSQFSSNFGPWHPVDCSGGIESTVVISGITYRLHMFTTIGSSSLRVNDSGTDGLIEYLVVAGGGGGGMDMCGGGGGGGMITGLHSVISGQTLSVVVGTGGLGAPGANERRSDGAGPQPAGHQYTIPATSGSNSVFGPYTAIGGGFGGSSYRGYTPGIAGGAGGSGGGASGYNDNAGTFFGGAGTTNQGFRGGNSTAAYYSGGGGGAGAQGVDSTAQSNGGQGRLSNILGGDVYFSGGGGGSAYSLANGGSGGLGGGGGGGVGTAPGGGSALNPGQAGGGGGPNSWANTRGGNAGANTGGGGGGGAHYNSTNSGGDGGSGIVVVRYPISRPFTKPVAVDNGLVLALDASSIESAPGSGTTWYDLSPSRLHATGGSAIVNRRVEQNQPYTTAHSNILNTDTHSIFFSIQLNGTSANYEKIFGYEAGGSDRSPGVWRWPSTRRLHWRYDPGNSSSDFSLSSIVDNSGTEFALNTWYYVGVVKNGATATRYVNGSVIGSSTVSSPKTAGTAQIKIFPVYSSSSIIRHVHIYNRSLSTEEVLQNYNSILPTLI
jgi:hypothetical protein